MCSYMSSVITQTCGWREEDVGQRLELGAGVAGAGRVRGRVEDQPLGARRDRGLEGFGRDLEAVLERARRRRPGVPPASATMSG